MASLETTSGSAITIKMGNAPLVAKSSILDGFKEGEDYYKAKTLVIASNNEYQEPSTAVVGDIIPPTVTIKSPEFSSELNTNTSSVKAKTLDGKTVYVVEFSGHVKDVSQLTELKIDGTDIDYTFNSRTGFWEFDSEIILKDGLNMFKILTEDKAGNMVEFKQEFFADLYNPVMSIDSNKIQYGHQGDNYWVVLNGYVSDTFPVLKFKAGKELIVNERDSFDEYNEKLKPIKVSLDNVRVPIEKNQTSLYLKLSDYGGYTVTETINIPQYIFASKDKDDDDDDDDDRSSRSGGSSGGSGGGSSSKSTGTQAKASKGSTIISASAFSKDKMQADRHVIIKAPAPSEKQEVKINLNKDAIKAAKQNKAILEIDAGIAKLNLDSVNLGTQANDTAELSIASIKGGTSVKIQKVYSEAVEKLKPLSDIIDIQLSFESNSSSVESSEIHDLTSPVSIEIPVEIDTNTVDVDKLGLFYNNEATGQWEYVGGKYNLETKTMHATLNHFSQYCIMERNIEFIDTDQHWAEDVISKIASKDIVSGYADGSFNPDGTISYAEFLTLVVKALDMETTYEGDKWYDAYIFTSRMNGLIDARHEFDPESNISREEMASILGKYLNQADTIEPKYDPIVFVDAEVIDDSNAEAVSSAVEFGLFSGRSDGSFDPKATATRAEVAQVIYDLIQLTN